MMGGKKFSWFMWLSGVFRSGVVVYLFMIEQWIGFELRSSKVELVFDPNDFGFEV